MRNPRVPSTWSLLNSGHEWVRDPNRSAPPQEMVYNVTLWGPSETPGCYATLAVYTVVFSVALREALTRAQGAQRAQRAQLAPRARTDSNRISGQQVLRPSI